MNDLSKLSVSELETLIAEAIQQRAELVGEPPNEPPKSGHASFGQAWHISLVPEGTLVQIRLRPFGWVAFVLPSAERAYFLSVLLRLALTDLDRAAQAATPIAPSADGSWTLH